MKYIGRQIDLGIGRESSRGVPVAPTYWVPRVDMSFDDKVMVARSDAGVGSLADSEEAFVTTKFGSGEITGEIRSDSFGLFLYSLLGSLSTTGPTDSAYTHSFTLSDSIQHQSLTLTVVDPNQTDQYRNCVVDSIEINSELDQVVKFRISFMGMTSKGASATPNYNNEYKFTKKHAKVKVAANIAGLSAATVLSLKSLTLSFNQNTIIDDVLGTAEPEDVLNRSMSIEGTLKLNYEDETWKEYMRNNTDRSLQIALVNNDKVIGAGTNPSLTLQFPKVDFLQWEPDNSNNEIVTQTVTFKANEDVTNDQRIISSCQLVNTVTSY